MADSENQKNNDNKYTTINLGNCENIYYIFNNFFTFA